MSEIRVIDDLRQRHVEAFFSALREQDALSKSGVEFAGITVRVAANVGILEGLKAEDVAEMLPARVIELSAQVNRTVNEALHIPGE